MGPLRRVLTSALAAAVCLGLLAGATRAAQLHEEHLRALGYSPDPFARTPRLLAMGALTLADDLHNRINLWEFAGNPTGLAEAESVTTLEFRPSLRTSASLHDVVRAPGRERQDLGARRMHHGFEAWRRAPGTPAYGVAAELATLQVDRPFGEVSEYRTRFTAPSILGVVNGRMPWIPTSRIDVGVRVGYGAEVEDNGYFEFLRLPQGDYLGRATGIVRAPDLFTPNRVESSSLGGGIGFAVRVTRDIRAAVNYDRARLEVRAKLEGLRSTSKVEEDRPVDVGQATLVGRLGRNLEWGADGRAWRSRSEEFFFWTLSAGQNQVPLSGSGKRLDRDERGTSLRTRARWHNNTVELGASFASSFRRTILTPWNSTRPGDPTGFNEFLTEVGNRVGADTLLLPARVRQTRIEERGYEVSGGGTWRLPVRRILLGAEVHYRRNRLDQEGVGGGPEPRGWDVRAGAEVSLGTSLLARAGWNYGLSDRDELTADNAYRRTLATAGFGYRPPGSSWSMDVAYAYEWVRPDFVDVTRSRGANQQVAAQMRWPL